MTLTIIAFAVAIFFAANIGASGTAAAMGSAYGSGAVRNRLHAVCLVALFAVLGAVIGGEGVITTISHGIIPSGNLTAQLTVVILCSACFTLFIANRLGIPLSTSEVTVGSLVGTGLAIGHVYWWKLLVIACSWLVLPFAAFAIAYVAGRLLTGRERLWTAKYPHLKTILKALLILAGCYEAFSAGMNNIANAVGPLIGAALVEYKTGLAVGVAFLALGAILMGGRVLETNGKKITSLSLLQGSIVSFTSGSLVIGASLLGLPVPLTQATTMAIIGVGAENRGFQVMFQSTIVRKILFVWTVSPLSSLIVSYSLTRWVDKGIGWPAVVLAAAALGYALFRYFRMRRFAGKPDSANQPQSQS
jgi:sulfate permease